MSRSATVWMAGLLLLGCNGGGTGASATFGVGGSVDPSGSGAPATDGEAPTGGDGGMSGGSSGSGAASGSGSTGGGESAGGGLTGAATASPTTSGAPEPPEGGSTSAGTGGGQTTAAPPKEPPPCVPVACGGKLYDCGDCEDNDGDGLVDAADPECVGPCDDREDTFATGIPGDNVDPCKQDCFFDGNSGQGKDDCTWNLKCDPLEPIPGACAYDEDFKCPDPDGENCLTTCMVPNGCDCFGCCTVVVGGQAHDIYIGDPDCSLAHFDKCAACTKVKTCVNDCDHGACEVCFGETEPPPGCAEPSCEDGLEPCVGSVCPQGFYCAAGTGCCFPAPG